MSVQRADVERRVHATHRTAHLDELLENAGALRVVDEHFTQPSSEVHALAKVVHSGSPQRLLCCRLHGVLQPRPSRAQCGVGDGGHRHSLKHSAGAVLHDDHGLSAS